MLMGVIDVVTATAPLVRSQPFGIGGSTFTWGALFSALQTLLLSIIGGGGAFAGLRIFAALKKISADREVKMREIDSTDDTSLRADLIKMLHDNDERAGKRITELERGIIDERRHCVDEMAAQDRRWTEAAAVQQKRCDEEIAQLRGEIKGLRDNQIQESRSRAVMIGRSPAVDAPTSMQALTDKMGDVE